jgi:adenylate kinase family enzyme
MTLGTRVVIVGNSGSGNSTLAQALAPCIAAPAIDLDHIHWQGRSRHDDESRSGRGFSLDMLSM